MQFFRTQRKYRFYSSSLLVAYDARKLQQHCCPDKKNPDEPMNPRTESVSFDSNNLTSHISNMNEREQIISTTSNMDTMNNSTQDQMDKPLLKKSISSSGPVSMKRIIDRNETCNLDQMSRSCPNQLSLQELLNNLKDDNTTAESTVSDRDKCNWVRINMIDFTHVFLADDDDSVDLNYLRGIENLINLLKNVHLEKV